MINTASIGAYFSPHLVGIKSSRNNIRAEKARVNVCNLGVKLLNGAVHCIEIMNVSQSVE